MFTLRQFLEQNGKEADYSNWRKCEQWKKLLLSEGFVFREFKRPGDHASRRWFGKPEEFVGHEEVPKTIIHLKIPGSSMGLRAIAPSSLDDESDGE